jgi:hypothetical protein
MLNYYNDDILEVLDYDAIDYLIDYDDVTGGLNGFNTNEPKKHCYNSTSDVKEGLEEYGVKILQSF